MPVSGSPLPTNFVDGGDGHTAAHNAANQRINDLQVLANATESATAGKAAASHTHTIANVTGLQTALDGKQAAGSYASASGLSSETTARTAADAALDARVDTLETTGPSGAAGGVLAGTYPNPSFAADMATQTELEAAVAGRQPASDALATIASLDSGQAGVIASDGAGWVQKSYTELQADIGAQPEWSVGVVSNSDMVVQIPRAAALGASEIRLEFDYTDTVTTIKPFVDQCASLKVRPLLLAAWDNGISVPDLSNLVTWAQAFGPGGTNWSGGDDSYAVRNIELGNENSYSYKSGTYDTPGYATIAQSYGTRARALQVALQAVDSPVKVLLELEDGGSGSANWVTNVVSTGTSALLRDMGGPTVHAYGPDWATKVNRNAKFLATAGSTKKFVVTETGIASDNGPAMQSDNYGYPQALTYDEAAVAFTAVVQGMKASPYVRSVFLYQVSDQRAPAATTNKEHYFGLVRQNGSAKGNLTSAGQALLTSGFPLSLSFTPVTPTPKTARVWLGDDVTVSSGSGDITFDVVEFNYGMTINGSGNIVVPVNGIYLVTPRMYFKSAAASGYRDILLKKNGSTVREYSASPDGGSDLRLTGADTLSLVAGDVLSLGWFQTTTFADIGGGQAAKTGLAVTMLGQT